MSSSSSNSSDIPAPSSSLASSVSTASTSTPTALDLCTRYSRDTYDALPSERDVCPNCGERSQWYCPNCFITILPDTVALPSLNLPLHVHILRGKEENERKSTAAHIKALDNKNTTIYYLPQFPKFDHSSRILVLYPSPTSVPISSLNLEDYDGLMVVDTTWGKVGGVLQCPEMIYASYTYVHLSLYHTLFWRHQPLGPQCLSTIEALYYFFREWEINRRKKEIGIAKDPNSRDSVDSSSSSLSSSSSSSSLSIIQDSQRTNDEQYYDGRYDNILLFFLRQYHRIQQEYTNGQKQNLKYSHRMRAGYIKGKDNNTETDNLHNCGKNHRVRSGWTVRADVLSAETAEKTLSRVQDAIAQLQIQAQRENSQTSLPDTEPSSSVPDDGSIEQSGTKKNSTMDNTVPVDPLVGQQHLFNIYVKRFEHQYASRSPSKAASANNVNDASRNTPTKEDTK